jgi:hypothetical protein
VKRLDLEHHLRAHGWKALPAPSAANWKSKAVMRSVIAAGLSHRFVLAALHPLLVRGGDRFQLVPDPHLQGCSLPLVPMVHKRFFGTQKRSIGLN